MSITVRGPGRCTECSFYVALQDHREGCSRTAPVQPGEADFGVYQGNFVEAIERIKATEHDRQWKAFTAPTRKLIGEGRAYALGALRNEAETVAGTSRRCTQSPTEQIRVQTENQVRGQRFAHRR
jgi:hypothetical protein